MEKLYVLKNDKGRIVGKVAYRDIHNAEVMVVEYSVCGGEEVHVDEITVDFAKRSVCYLYLYRGFEYGYDMNGNGIMYDVDGESKVFSCSDEAKKHPWWIDAVKKYEESPENYYMDRDTISSYDGIWEEKFCYGDVMEGKFRLSIERLKVRR